jgi:5-methylthioribose kinase
LKVLLDENVAHDLRQYLHRHETMTAAYAGFAGYENGRLLDAAENAGFDVLVTGDRTLHCEQNLTGRAIALISLSAVSWPVIEAHVAKIVAAVDCAKPGSFTHVDVGRFRR